MKLSTECVPWRSPVDCQVWDPCGWRQNRLWKVRPLAICTGSVPMTPPLPVSGLSFIWTNHKTSGAISPLSMPTLFLHRVKGSVGDPTSYTSFILEHCLFGNSRPKCIYLVILHSTVFGKSKHIVREQTIKRGGGGVDALNLIRCQMTWTAGSEWVDWERLCPPTCGRLTAKSWN